jgi:hypothetical protein
VQARVFNGFFSSMQLKRRELMLFTMSNIHGFF